MKMQTKDLGNKSIIVRLALYKVGITACLAIIISIFLFACGSANNSNNTDTTASMQGDTSSIAPIDTAAVHPDTTGVKPDTTPVH
jgi:hypothetical protein